MTSSRPYIVRALYEWIVDNDFTPHIVVDAQAPDASVPQQHVNGDGHIVLNISPSAVVGLELSKTSVSFSARFGGVPTDIFVPGNAILGIYARENGQGMMFDPEPSTDPDPQGPKPKGPKKVPGSDGENVKPIAGKKPEKRPSLRIVK